MRAFKEGQKSYAQAPRNMLKKVKNAVRDAPHLDKSISVDAYRRRGMGKCMPAFVLCFSLEKNKRHHGFVADMSLPGKKEKEYDRRDTNQCNHRRVIPWTLVSAPLESEKKTTDCTKR